MSVPNATGTVVDGRYEVLDAGGDGAGTVRHAVLRPSGTAVSLEHTAGPVSGGIAAWIPLRHPNLAAVREVGASGEGGFVVYDPVPERSLAELLQAPLAPEEAARIGAGVARALQHLHRAGMVHGGVEPSRIRVGDRPVLLPRRQPPAAWVAPEGPADVRSDVWTLGVLLYRMIAGAVPAAVDPIPPIQVAVPATLEHVARRALQLRPADRYRDAGEVANALDAWLDTRAGRTPAPEPHGRTASGIAATVGSVAVGLVLLGIGVGALGYEFWTTRRGVEVELVGPPGEVVPSEVVVDGVPFDPAHAERALSWLNEASAEDLAAAGVYERAVSVLLGGRPFGSLEAVGATSGIGEKTLQVISAETR